ncbi:MAG: response regulator [Pontibacterium sp.]
MARLSQTDLNILLVEPSPMQRKVIAHELNREQVTAIDEAASVHEALESILSITPDLVASALYFEDGTAMDLIQEIRVLPQCKDTHFMLVSSETRHAQLEAFKQSGVVAILPKPFTHQHLKKSLCATVDLLSPEELELDNYDTESMRALVVDDSAMARKMILRVLNNLGILNITEASDGVEAQMILAGTEEFDFVVTDYNMPHMDGAELTSYIRQTDRLAHLPVMMVTSVQDETKLSHIHHSGIDALIDKPFSSEEVKRWLHTLLES